MRKLSLILCGMLLLIACSPVQADKSSFRCAGSWFIPPSFHGNAFSQGGDGSHLPFIYEQAFIYIPGSREFVPQLALKSEINATRTRQTLNLRQNVSWHDEQPFSAKDVKTTFLIYWLQGWGGNLGSIETPDANQVVFNWRKAANTRDEREVMLRRVQAPVHLYGKWADQAEALLQQATAIPLENASPAQQKQVETIQVKKAELLQAIYQFRPETPIGTNAYQIEKVTASELVLKRYLKSWHTQVSVPRVRILRGASNDVVWAYTLGGDIDASHSAIPQDVAEQILKLNPKTRLIELPDYMSFGYVLNTQLAPLNQLVLRQALAYLLDRDMQRMVASYYSLTSDAYHLPIMSQYADQWLKPDFHQGLTAYDYQPELAQRLLAQAGYQRDANQHWQNPQGQPLSLEIAAISGYSDWVLASEAYANRLTQFGIPTQVRTYDAALYFQLFRQGKFQMAASFGYDFKMFPHPAASFDRFFSANGMVAKASGIKPFYTLPSGERIMLQRVVEEIVNGSERKPVQQRVADLSRLANAELPFLNVYEKQIGVLVLEGERVKGWPAATDPVWSVNAAGMETAYAYLLSSGRLSPAVETP